MARRHANGRSMDEQVILDGDPPIALVLKPSARARRLSLRVSRLDGRVTLSLPRGASRRHALAFAAEKADWIRRQLATQPITIRPMPGGTLRFRGEALEIVTHDGRGVRLADGRLAVPARDPDRTPARLMAFLKTHARDALAGAAGHYAEALGRPHGRITLRDTRSRWGSCGRDDFPGSGGQRGHPAFYNP